MEDNVFLDKIRDKIEKITRTEVSLVIDEEDENKVDVDLAGDIPQVVMGSAVLKYPGFARMCIEYVVASIRTGRRINTLEFHVMLGRN